MQYGIEKKNQYPVKKKSSSSEKSGVRFFFVFFFFFNKIIAETDKSPLVTSSAKIFHNNVMKQSDWFNLFFIDTERARSRDDPR